MKTLIKKLIMIAVIFTAFNSIAQSIKVNADLINVKNDQIKVEIEVPNYNDNVLTYKMPKMVPGTYSIYDFGRFIHQFKAYDKNGSELNYTKPDINTWKIENANNLAKISYWVEDTYDTDSANVVFEPAGVNFEENKNFVLNLHGLVGYFDGKKKSKYELKISKPSQLYGSTALIATSANNTTDVFEIDNYMDLVDSPIMYSVPDTTIMNIGGTEILVSVYSPKQLVKSNFIASEIKEILVAAKDYLGGKLPIQKYAFIIYLFNGKSKSGSAGALEHSYSSMYFLQEIKQENIANQIRDIAAHEFYHIITPLTIHSEEIGDFDFNEPKMSKHLWLYEGVTEYTSDYVQLKQGLITFNDFLERMKMKLKISQKFFNDTLPFTHMSKTCLHEHKEQYGNVYEKGALIGFCLDVELRYLSNGNMGLQDVINYLSKKYGKTKSFRDEDLFAEITSITYPEIGIFFEKYLNQPNPLPIESTLMKLGINYIKNAEKLDFSFGNVAIAYDKPFSNYLFIKNITGMNEFGKKIGYQEGDELVSLNGKSLLPNNFENTIVDWKKTVKKGDKVVVKVQRTDVNGKKEIVVLKTKAFKVTQVQDYLIEPIEKLTELQKKIRNAWIGSNS